MTSAVPDWAVLSPRLAQFQELASSKGLTLLLITMYISVGIKVSVRCCARTCEQATQLSAKGATDPSQHHL